MQAGYFWQAGQICEPSGVICQPFSTALITSPSNQARPSEILRPLRSSMRVDLRNSIDRKP